MTELRATVEDVNRENASLKEQVSEKMKTVNLTMASKEHAELERD